MIVFLLVLWWVTGSASFIYWWASSLDLTLVNGFLSVLVGIFGPIAFFMGWLIHGKSNTRAKPIVLIKARK